jgi:hypothetical protein
MTRDLQALLANAPIEGPYVLVGHSMGGMLVRVFADQYPEDVAGLVLVDSAHPDMGARLLAALPAEARGEPDSLKAWRRYGAWMSTSDGKASSDVEGVDLAVSNEQVRAVKPLGDLPLAVISRSPNNPVMAAQMPSLPVDVNAGVMQLWQDMQDELAGLSSNSTRLIADHSGHYIHLEEPRLVAEAIRWVVNEYRAQAGMTVPPGPSQTEAASHRPVILSVAERKERQNGALIIYEDFRFTDAAGDAITVVNNVISATFTGEVYDDVIRASADEQKGEALVTSRMGCYRQSALVIEFRIADAAGNMSEPVTVTFQCPAPQRVLWPILLGGLAIGAGLLVGAWLLAGYRRAGRAQAAPA